MDACVYVTSEYAKLYFILFYSISVLVVMNVLTAFVLEAFLMQQQREETVKENDRRRKRRVKERAQRAEEAKRTGVPFDEDGLTGHDALLDTEAEQAARAEERLQPRCYPKLRELAEGELHQHVVLRKPTGMGAVLLRMYQLSVVDEG